MSTFCSLLYEDFGSRITMGTTLTLILTASCLWQLVFLTDLSVCKKDDRLRNTKTEKIKNLSRKNCNERKGGMHFYFQHDTWIFCLRRLVFNNQRRKELVRFCHVSILKSKDFTNQPNLINKLGGFIRVYVVY